MKENIELIENLNIQNFWDYCKEVASFPGVDNNKVRDDIDVVARAYDLGWSPWEAVEAVLERYEKLPPTV